MLGFIPLVRYQFKIRETILDVEELKKESTDNIHYYKKELEALRTDIRAWKTEIAFEHKVETNRVNKEIVSIKEDMTSGTLQFTEILGRINVTLERLEGAVRNLNETIGRVEKNNESATNRLYSAFQEHKDDVRRELEIMRK